MKLLKNFKKAACLLMCSVVLVGCQGANTNVETKKSSSMQLQEDSKKSQQESEIVNLKNNMQKKEESNEIQNETVEDKKTEELNESIQIKDGRESYRYTYDPYAIPDMYVEKYGEKFYTCYKGFCDAVLAGEDHFECPDYDTYWKVLDVAWVFLPITTDCLDMPVYDDNTIKNGVCEIVYRHSKEKHLNNVKEFLDKVKMIITTSLQEGDTEFEKALKLFQYCSTTFVYDYEQYETGKVSGDKQCGGYRIIMDEIGICQEYATAYAFLLLQAGMEADVVSGGNDEVGHAWNIVEIEKKHYYMDTTFQSSRLGSPLYYFGVPADTYAELSEFPVSSHTIGGSANMKIPYDISDKKFEKLRECSFYDINHEERTIDYEGYIYEDTSYESEDRGKHFEGKLEF